jgi:hypothetical protein
MKRLSLTLFAGAAVAAVTLAVACSDSTSPRAGSGTLAVRLTDAPFSSDSVSSVDIFVVRVDGRVASADDAAANDALTDPNAAAAGWQTIATPNASYDLLALQNGTTVALGDGELAAGTYNGFRLIIDPSKSSVTLKNGQVLSGTTTPNVSFPSGAATGIKIVLAQPVTIDAGATTNLLLDFKVNDSFVMRGNSISQNGLLFKPVIQASITNTGTTTASTTTP